MGKLHEVLAVEGDLAGTSKKILDETRNTFGKKPTHFQGDTQVTAYFAEDQSHLNATTQTAMVTTVIAKLEYMGPVVAKYWDAYVSKEASNQIAKADVLLDGKVFLTNVPATVLLGMETKLKELRTVYEEIPTLQPGVFWEKAPEMGDGVYRAKNPEERIITAKTVVPIELSPATKEHKAQVQVLNSDVPVAKRVITNTSGMLSPSEKSDLLERTDNLIRAVKEARQRANTVEAVVQKGFGDTIFGYLHYGD